MVKELNGGHSERSEAESKNPAAVRRGYATGFLDFARNDGHSKASTLQCFNGPSDRPLPQCVIAKNERGHCFDNRHGSWKNTRIMPSPGSKLSLLVRSGDGFLLERNRCRRLKGNAKVNVFAIANTTLHASGVVRGCPNSSSADFECIVVLRAPH